MATAFAADWTAAKTAFSTATNKKKPSASFLGVFNKGTGIGSALKEADAAKNAGDFIKAMKAFKTSFDDYVKTLDKAIADPKLTNPADKPAYSAAALKLKTELMNIYTSAGKVSQTMVGEKKVAPVDPNALKEAAEAQRFAALKPQLEELYRVKASTKMNLQELRVQGMALLDAMGNLIAASRPEGETGGNIADFLKDPEIKKLHDGAKIRYDSLQTTYEKHLANYNTAVRLRDAVGEAYKAEFDDLINDKANPPLTFAKALAEELAKKPGKKKSDQKAAASEEVKARLNPRHMTAKLADMSKLNDLLFSHCTAATKAKQVGGAEKAKASLAEAQKLLVQMQAIFKPINDDYSNSNKEALKALKDGKDIMEKFAKITALQTKANQTVAETKKLIG